MRCVMTGILIRDSGDGVWDDGEWISWDYINGQIAGQEAGARRKIEFSPEVQPQGAEIVRLIAEAVEQEKGSTMPSPLWGEIGELYVAERFGVVLGREHAQGHDGRLGHDLVEIKTITPRKQRPFARVKRTGNFSILAVVRVNRNYLLDAGLLRREKLARGSSKFATVSWTKIREVGDA